jgi:hypothetical protein
MDDRGPHAIWYKDNHARYKALKKAAEEGKSLTIKECDFMSWWEGYRMTCPDPDRVPKHSTMIIRKDQDPMEG